MVKMDIYVRVANDTVYAMEVLPPKGQPFLKGNTSLWMSHLSLKFPERYGNVAQLLFVKMDDSLLKAMGCYGKG
ncbi:hypothetical protein Golob_017745 [Gossypium lobatum]|uniref:Uncharacterized protein n=1 Tax=Gossypium lobatum TaxID=34289 RepID=A0A7J8M8D0_9ROSI|nr:hypothetical protein [Gossypium lobatum]